MLPLMNKGELRSNRLVDLQPLKLAIGPNIHQLVCRPMGRASRMGIIDQSERPNLERITGPCTLPGHLPIWDRPGYRVSGPDAEGKGRVVRQRFIKVNLCVKQVTERDIERAKG